MFGKQNFFTGCNYWASHAGTSMWKEWNPEIIKADFAKMKELHLEIVRIFPLWPEFQPLTCHACVKNTPYQLRWKNDEEIPFDSDGYQSGVDPVMLDRFRFVCDCAYENGISLGVGLITGWMSGKIYAPPAFEQRALLRDPLVIRWQLKFIKRFVSEFKNHPAIGFWGIGNECNCLDQANRFEGALWTRTISNAIRAIDPDRPIAAGLHGIAPQPETKIMPSETWSIFDMAEDFDALTIHPYPLFSEHTAIDGIKGFKATMHASAEAHFFGDIGRKPCVAEEVGTLSPTLANEKSAAEYLRKTLYQLWAHDCEGLFWWCTFDQDHLEHPPYQWCAVERQLGLFRLDGSRKPVADVLSEFAEQKQKLPFQRLPRFQKEVICILTENQDCWMAAYGAWCLAKQAGFDLEFQFADEPLRESKYYLLPAISGLNNIPRNRYLELMEKVKQGAQLVCTFDGACLAPFDKFFGVSSEYQENYDGTSAVEINGSVLDFPFSSRITLIPSEAEILLNDSDGKPFLSKNRLGSGIVYFMTYSPELAVVKKNRAIEKPYFECYRICFSDALQQRIFLTGSSTVTATLHQVNHSEFYAVVINNGNECWTPEKGTLAPGWNLEIISSTTGEELKPTHAMVLSLKKA